MGRTKGSKNKATLAKEAAIAKTAPVVKGRTAVLICGYCSTGHHDQHKPVTKYSMGVITSSKCPCKCQDL